MLRLKDRDKYDQAQCEAAGSTQTLYDAHRRCGHAHSKALQAQMLQLR